MLVTGGGNNGTGFFAAIKARKQYFKRRNTCPIDKIGTKNIIT